MKQHSVEQLQEMVEYCRDRHRSPAYWLALLARARLVQIKAEVSANRRLTREKTITEKAI